MAIERTVTTVTTESVAYRVGGGDGVTFSATGDGTSIVVTSDDPEVNANVRIRVTSIPALLALLASVQVNAIAAPDPVATGPAPADTPSTDPAPTDTTATGTATDPAPAETTPVA